MVGGLAKPRRRDSACVVVSAGAHTMAALAATALTAQRRWMAEHEIRQPSRTPADALLILHGGLDVIAGKEAFLCVHGIGLGIGH